LVIIRAVDNSFIVIILKDELKKEKLKQKERSGGTQLNIKLSLFMF
jgi:hypothetical protein